MFWNVFLEFKILKSDTYLEQRRDSIMWNESKEKTTIIKNMNIIIQEQQYSIQ